MRVKCTVQSSYENKILNHDLPNSSIFSIKRDVVGTALCGDCIAAFTYSDCRMLKFPYGNISITLTPCFGPAEWF